MASDLGFEKYMDIVMPSSGIKPAACVLVTTVQSVRNQGGGDLQAGFANLKKHIAIVRSDREGFRSCLRHCTCQSS